MEDQVVHEQLLVTGMTCSGCERRIEKKLKQLAGIVEAKADYVRSQVAVTYRKDTVGRKTIVQAIEQLGYKVVGRAGQRSGLPTDRKKEDQLHISQLLGIGIIILAIYEIIKNTIGFNFIPQVNKSMGYGLLFVVGLITSIHCLAMCGGINLSQCITGSCDNKKDTLTKLRPSLMYNIGRVISYTVVGGIVGALGSVVSFSGTAKGIVAIIAGIFMVIMGLNMLNIFPWLRKFNLRMPKQIGNLVDKNSGRGPFFVGLLNGLMPCGPLQAMQLYALGTGSFRAGAVAMFVFSLGTVPLMFSFGAVSSFLSNKFTRRMMKVSAVLVVALGILMLSRGLNLSGINPAYATTTTGSVAKINGNVQEVTSSMKSGNYTPIVVQKGIPVVWTLKATAQDLNGCNNALTIPAYNVQKQLVPGDNVIKFTPTKEGTISYSCWMGMVSSTIAVVPDLTKVSSQDVDRLNNQKTPVTGGGSGSGCCARGGAVPGSNLPTTSLIKKAEVNNNKQEVTITVDGRGFTPTVVVLQKGIPAKFKFKPGQLNGCNSTVIFPEFNGGLNLQSNTETPYLPTDNDFTFQCGMGMIQGYAKVVDNLNQADLNQIRKEIGY